MQRRIQGLCRQQRARPSSSKRWSQTTDKLTVGDPRRQEVFMGPVINDKSLDRFINAVKRSGERAGRSCLAASDWAAIRSTAALMSSRPSSSACRSITGSTATNCSCRSSACCRSTIWTKRSPTANRSAFGLTAGIYTQDKSELDRFLNTIEAGVLYANRASGATTGAWPGFQTFCGWKGSGTSGKGGLGSWYVPQFMREQSHTLVRLAREQDLRFARARRLTACCATE